MSMSGSIPSYAMIHFFPTPQPFLIVQCSEYVCGLGPGHCMALMQVFQLRLKCSNPLYHRRSEEEPECPQCWDDDPFTDRLTPWLCLSLPFSFPPYKTSSSRRPRRDLRYQISDISRCIFSQTDPHSSQQTFGHSCESTLAGRGFSQAYLSSVISCPQKEPQNAQWCPLTMLQILVFVPLRLLTRSTANTTNGSFLLGENFKYRS